MVAMTVLLVVVGVVLVAAVATAGVRRRLADERHSVRDYQQTLETLRHLSEGGPAAAERAQRHKATGARAKVPKDRAATMLAPATRSSGRGRRAVALAAKSGVPAVSTSVGSPLPRPVQQRVDTPEVSAEAPVPARAAQAVRELIAHPELHGPVRSRSMPGARRRPPPAVPPMVWTVAAAVVVAVVTAVALAMGPSRPSRSSAPPVTNAPPVRHLSATKPSASHRSSTPPPPAALDPVTSSTTSATYDLPPSPAALTLTASGPCWVQATVPSSGQVLWTGTLQAGHSQTIPVVSGALLRLGDASNVLVAVGSEQVHLPSRYALVFDLTFLPA